MVSAVSERWVLGAAGLAAGGAAGAAPFDVPVDVAGLAGVTAGIALNHRTIDGLVTFGFTDLWYSLTPFSPWSPFQKRNAFKAHP